MAVRNRPSDFSKAAQGGFPACSGVKEKVMCGDLRADRTASENPAQAKRGEASRSGLHVVLGSAVPL